LCTDGLLLLMSTCVNAPSCWHWHQQLQIGVPNHADACMKCVLELIQSC
jgi:hypothetical protein